MMRPSPRGDVGSLDRGQRPRRPSGRARMSWLAGAGYLGLALACLVAGSIAFLLVAPPLDAVRDRLIRQVHERTGRTLAIAGPLSVSLLPRPVVFLEGVTLLPPEGMADGPTATVRSIEAEMSLWSLLSRRPKPDRLTLHGPAIDLVVDAQGRRSWDAGPRSRRLASPTFATPPKAAPAAAPPASKAPARARRQRPIAVRVVDGTVRYRDARSGRTYNIGALALDVTADPAGAALVATGGFAFEGVPFRFSAAVPRVPDAPVVVRIAGVPLEATYEGSLAVQGGVSAEGTLTVAHAAYRDVSLGPAKLAVSVAGGVARVALQDGALYGGRGQGSLTVDTTGRAGAPPVVSANLTLKDVSLRPLLQDAAGLSWLDGRGAVTLTLAGQGTSERQIVETLRGRMQLAVADGAVTGLDVDRVLGALRRGRLGGLAPRREDRTPFSALTGSFDIAGGIAKTNDLKLVSTHVELRGEGQIELAARRIDATLQTKIDGGSPSDDAAVNIGTLELPIGIKGALDEPEFTIKGQEALTDAIGRISRNLKSREVQDALEGLLGGDRGKRVKPEELLERLLK